VNYKDTFICQQLAAEMALRSPVSLKEAETIVEEFLWLGGTRAEFERLQKEVKMFISESVSLWIAARRVPMPESEM